MASKPLFFPTQHELRQWFIDNHKTATELILGYYKKSTGIPSVDWPQSVDEALCFGWIDGRRNSIDEQCYQVRFTPRRVGSHWSAVNIDKIKKLTDAKLMYPMGLEAWQKRDKANQMQASYEQGPLKLAKPYEAKIKANQAAWDYFTNQLAPSYKKLSIHWVMSAKRETTQLTRLEKLIDSCANSERLPQFRWKKKQ